MSKGHRLDRRTVLRGIGTAVGLPLLEAMMPVSAVRAATNRAPETRTPPVRLAVLYFPNGVAEGAWEPERVGTAQRIERLNKWMAPLERFKQELIIPKNMWTPEGNGHGAGTATWLTGSGYDSRRIKTGGISVDQLAARHIGRDTLLPSLELSVKGEGFFSNSLVRNALSWRSPTMPAPRETEPRIIFDRMFRSGAAGLSDRSALDLILEDARSLKRAVGRNDQHKVDEYLDSIRSVERRLEFAEKQAGRARDSRLQQQLVRPADSPPEDHGEYLRTMLDMQVLAFWSDATRVSTFMLDHGQSNRYFNFIEGVQGTWHALSHWMDASGETEDDDGVTSWDSVEQKREMYNAVTRWHHEQVAYFLGRLQSIREPNGSLLDNSMILYGSSLADGHEHAAENLPLLLAGRGGGTIEPGRFVEYKKQTSLSDLHLAVLQRLGVKLDQFGGSRRPMSELAEP